MPACYPLLKISFYSHIKSNFYASQFLSISVTSCGVFLGDDHSHCRKKFLFGLIAYNFISILPLLDDQRNIETDTLVISDSGKFLGKYFVEDIFSFKLWAVSSKAWLSVDLGGRILRILYLFVPHILYTSMWIEREVLSPLFGVSWSMLGTLHVP